MKIYVSNTDSIAKIILKNDINFYLSISVNGSIIFFDKSLPSQLPTYWIKL